MKRKKIKFRVYCYSFYSSFIGQNMHISSGYAPGLYEISSTFLSYLGYSYTPLLPLPSGRTSIGKQAPVRLPPRAPAAPLCMPAASSRAARWARWTTSSRLHLPWRTERVLALVALTHHSFLRVGVFYLPATGPAWRGDGPNPCFNTHYFGSIITSLYSQLLQSSFRRLQASF